MVKIISPFLWNDKIYIFINNQGLSKFSCWTNLLPGKPTHKYSTPLFSKSDPFAKTSAWSDPGLGIGFDFPVI